MSEIEQMTEAATSAAYVATLEQAEEVDYRLAKRKLAEATLLLARQELESAQTAYNKAKQALDELGGTN